MTSRERLLKALNHDEPDRIPIDLGGNQTGIHKFAYEALTQHLGTDAKLWYHTCGNCVEYIPDLLENGVQILNPVQISAEGMDPATLKARFGNDLVFWGGAIDSQHVLPSATPERIREDVRQHLAIWKPGGGYVFNNVHNIQAGVPAENIVALYDAAYEFGFYGG